MRNLFTLLALLLPAGCGSPGAIVVSGVDDSSTYFDGFPAQSLEGIVYSQAAFDNDYEETFDTDLIERGVVPIRVTIQLRGEGQERAQILVKPDRMGARLYLLDGTALPHAPADRVAAVLEERTARLVRKHALPGGLLGATPNEGYLFFSLQPEQSFETFGRVVRHHDGEVTRRLDLTHSLLAFDVMVEDAPQPFYVGIQR